MLLDFTKHYCHQAWEVEPGIKTPGVNDVEALLDLVEFPADLSGKTILDIGAWSLRGVLRGTGPCNWRSRDRPSFFGVERRRGTS
jgi:hypothetical protein